MIWKSVKDKNERLILWWSMEGKQYFLFIIQGKVKGRKGQESRCWKLVFWFLHPYYSISLCFTFLLDLMGIFARVPGVHLVRALLSLLLCLDVVLQSD